MNVTTQGIGHKVMSVLMALVLAIGLAPMVPAGTALAATDQENWDAATYVYTAEANEDDEYVIDYTGEPVAFGVVSVTEVGSSTALDPEAYEVAYYSNNAGTPGAKIENGAEGVVEPGDYWIGVTSKEAVGSTETPVTHYQKFTIAPKGKTSILGAKIYQATADPNDVSDETFVYTGKEFYFGTVAGYLNVQVDDKPLVKDTDYELRVDPQNPTIKEAGTYDVTIIGKGNYEGTLYTKVVIAPIDLDTATVTIADQDIRQVTNSPLTGSMVLIDGVDATTLDLDDELAYEFTGYEFEGAAGVPEVIKNVGHYTASVAAEDTANNVTGSKSGIEFDVVSNVVMGYDYTNGTVTDSFADWNSAGLVFDNSKDEAFDPEKITVGGGAVAKDRYTVTVTKDGVKTNDWTEAGDYVATVKVSTGDEYDMGGTGTLKFSVINGTIATASDIFVIVDGKNVQQGTDLHVTYTGEAFDVTTVVKNDEGETLTAGVDYNVEITDSTGAKVDEILGVGGYQVHITDGAYHVAAGTGSYIVRVDKIAIQGYRAVQINMGDTEGLPYTGEAVVPAVEYTTDNPASEDAVWKALDPALYELKYSNADNSVSVDAEDVVEPAIYTATVWLTDEAKETMAEAVNQTFKFRIVDTIAYSDVKAGEWYANPVYQAKKLGYMTGVDGTTTFLPATNITRAEMACVVYKMVGGQYDADDTTFEAPFADVEMSFSWAVPAISWANKAGVITGYAPDYATFGPGDNATREQVATILYRYAQATGQDVTVEDEAAALEKYADGDQVSEYARTAMAWAIENGIMGVDIDSLRPQDNIVRAEVAAMSVRVQPESYEGSVDIDVSQQP